MASTRRRSAAVARLCGLPAALLAVSVAAPPALSNLKGIGSGHRPVPFERTLSRKNRRCARAAEFFDGDHQSRVCQVAGKGYSVTSHPVGFLYRPVAQEITLAVTGFAGRNISAIVAVASVNEKGPTCAGPIP